MSYSDKGKAEHYNTQRVEVMVLLERSYGTVAAMTFCEMNVMKYRMRLGSKKDQPIDQELLKITWYESKAEHYRKKIGSCEEIVIENGSEEVRISK